MSLTLRRYYKDVKRPIPIQTNARNAKASFIWKLTVSAIQKWTSAVFILEVFAFGVKIHTDCKEILVYLTVEPFAKLYDLVKYYFFIFVSHYNGNCLQKVFLSIFKHENLILLKTVKK